MRGIMVAAFTAASVAGCAGTGQLPADTEATDFSLNPEAFRSEGIGFLLSMRQRRSRPPPLQSPGRSW